MFMLLRYIAVDWGKIIILKVATKSDRAYYKSNQHLQTKNTFKESIIYLII